VAALAERARLKRRIAIGVEKRRDIRSALDADRGRRAA